MSHTPGPWEIERSFNGCWVDGITSGKVTICYGSIDEANARLIAAAPELLAMLKRAADDLGFNEICGLAHDGEVAGEFRALIAKVEGK